MRFCVYVGGHPVVIFMCKLQLLLWPNIRFIVDVITHIHLKVHTDKYVYMFPYVLYIYVCESVIDKNQVCVKLIFV